MANRRTVIVSLGAVAAQSLAGRAGAANPVPPGIAAPKLIAGKPPVLDFGEDVHVPCSKEAFLTLWEGKSFWLTFGAGHSHYAFQAQGKAEKYAKAAMALLLLTLAFEPTRLAHVEGGGWRLKSGNIKDLVKGDINLPGKPYWTNTDAFRGFGATDAPGVGSLDFGNSESNVQGAMQVQGATDVMTGTFHYVDAFSVYVVLKRDVSLDFVRTYGQVVPAG